MSPRPINHSKAVGMLLQATLYWGLSFPLIKAIEMTHGGVLPGSTNWFITACTNAPRFLLAVILLTLFRGISGWRMTYLEIKQGAGVGLFSALGLLFQIDGLLFTTASTSAFLTQLYAILIPIWMAVWRRRLPPLTVWVSCFLVLVGVAVLSRLNVSDIRIGRGEGETLIASCFFMVQILWLERKEFAENRAFQVTLAMFVCEAILFLGMVAVVAPGMSSIAALCSNYNWIGYTLLLTLFCTIGAFLLMNRWQPQITATEAGLIYCAEPLFASVMALFLPALFSQWSKISYANETLSVNLLVGGGLITLANILIQLRPPKSA